MTLNTTIESLPKLPEVIKDNDNSKKIMHLLRHFHLGNPKAAAQLESVSDNYLPALLAAYRDASSLRYDYPLYLSPVDASHSLSLSIAKPVSDFILERVDAFAAGADSARVLRDNLPWIERELREDTRSIEGPSAIKPLIQKACEKLVQHLHLDTDNQLRLESDIKQLLEQISDEGLILGYGRFPALHLLMHLIRNKVIPRISLFKEETEQYIKELKNLLDVDDSKREEASSSAALDSNLASNKFFNTESLSKIVRHSHGTVAMSDVRRQRIENALNTLKDFKEKETLVHIVHSAKTLDNSQWLDQSSCFTSINDDDPCSKATDIFDQEAQELAKVFAAARIARLELKNLYDEDIHDPWFNNFNWETFSPDELILVPSVIVLEGANRLAGESMVSFSRLLNSGRPVNIFVRVQAHNNPGATDNEDPFQSYRTELGYIGISHRQAVVTQSSAARHQHLLNHFDMALNATRTSLHLINVGLRETGQDMGLNAWLVAGAALEGRAHPFFAVNPGAGDSAADRMDFEGNPQPDKDWPSHKFAYINEGGDVSELDLDFTFADYSLLIPRLHQHFALIPAECESDDLILVSDYLAMPSQQAENFVPFIWTVDQNNQLRMLAITRALIHACRDRLNFWHSLQEMAGVRSRYIEQAEQRIKSEAEQQISEQLAQAKVEYEAELERVKTETAAQVMSRLTDILLGLDLTSTASAGFAVSAAPAATATSPTEVAEEVNSAEPAEEVAQEEDEGMSFDEPWIDTPLCTTCNDCTDMNPLMFVYNDTNQAVIADLSAGTYLQMVEAAEVCPSKCIHPGKPWDKNESNLDDLMQRAEPFNQL